MARTVTVGKDALGGDFAAAPVGTKVLATIHEIEETTVKSETSPNKGKPQAVVSVKVQGEFNFYDDKGKLQRLSGREIRYNNVPLYGDGNNAYQLAAFAEAVGWPVNDEGEIQIPDQDQLYLTQGKEVVVKLGVRSDNKDPDKKYNTVSNWLPADAKVSASAAAGAPAGGGTPGGNPWA